MKYTYIAVTIRGDRNKCIFLDQPNREPAPGYYSYVIKCSESDNIKKKLDIIGGLVTASIMTSRKHAAETVERWNATYKVNGAYLFDNP
jgi:hypothetical protein